MTERARSRIGTAASAALIAGILGAAFGAGAVWLWTSRADTESQAVVQPDSAPTSQPVSSEDEILFWTCGMHPSVRSDEPGKCPICFMDLVPVRASDQSSGDGEDVLARLRVNEQGRVLAMIETVPVVPRHLEHEINTTGRLTLDERRVTHIHTRIGGWIDEVFVDFTGVEIDPGDSLVSIYSEELVTAQREYLLARGNTGQRGGDAIVEASRQRLLRWGITPEQISALEQSGEIQDELVIHYQPAEDTPHGGTVIERMVVEGHHVNVGDRLFTVADLTTLWMVADVYESEMAWVRVGQQVEITTRAYPGRVFEGQIAFIEPSLDPITRSVQVRVDVRNPDMELRPEMWVDARIRVPLDHTNEVLAGLRESAERLWENRLARSEPLEPTSQPAADAHENMGHPPIADAPYLCPMLCDGGHSEEPGQHCPVCGMEMLPRADALEMAAAIYPSLQSESDTPTTHPSPTGPLLAIPNLSVLRTGEREVVYVEEEPGVYAAREVITGPTGTVIIDGQPQTYVPVLVGLQEGMRVVTRGNFLLDSQSTLTGGAAAAYGSALDTGSGSMPPGHQH